MWRSLTCCAAALTLLTSTARSQSLRDRITQLFIFGPGENPLFLAGTADPSNPASIIVHGSHFVPSAVASNGTIISFITNAISGNVADFPFSAAGGGTTFRFVGGVPVRTSSSAGPVFAERAQTLGRGRALVGVTYNTFHYTSLRGVPLDDIHLTFTHQNVDNPACDSVAGRDCEPMGVPTLENDIMPFVLNLQVDVRLMSFTLTYGLWDRLDIGLALPIVTTTLRGRSNAQTVPFGGPTAAHFFAGTPSSPVLSASRTTEGSASGLGDVALRAKLDVRHSERTSAALLLDGRFPTGSAEDLLGAGKFSGRLLGVLSARFGNFSPHTNLGYLVRGGSLRNDAVVATVGFDHLLAPWATLAADLVSQFQVGASKLQQPGDVTITVPFLRTVTPSQIPDRRDDLINGSFGFKLTTREGPAIITNVIVPLNRGGLRPNVLWTFGLEYGF